MKKEKKQQWMILSLAIMLIISSVSGLISSIYYQNELEDVRVEMKHEADSIKTERDSLENRLDDLYDMSLGNIQYWLDTFNISHADVVVQQIILETGNLTSAICLENNNLFGMKEPRVRETTALGTKRGHAYYKNYIESIKDYKLWQEDRNVNDQICYYTFLSEVGYAEANHYINALKNI